MRTIELQKDVTVFKVELARAPGTFIYIDALELTAKLFEIQDSHATDTTNSRYVSDVAAAVKSIAWSMEPEHDAGGSRPTLPEGALSDAQAFAIGEKVLKEYARLGNS